MTTYYPKKLNYKPEGRRNIGRPQTIWGDHFREEETGQRAKALMMMIMILIWIFLFSLDNSQLIAKACQPTGASRSLIYRQR